MRRPLFLYAGYLLAPPPPSGAGEGRCCVQLGLQLGKAAFQISQSRGLHTVAAAWRSRGRFLKIGTGNLAGPRGRFGSCRWCLCAPPGRRSARHRCLDGGAPGISCRFLPPSAALPPCWWWSFLLLTSPSFGVIIRTRGTVNRGLAGRRSILSQVCSLEKCRFPLGSGGGYFFI